MRPKGLSITIVDFQPLYPISYALSRKIFIQGEVALRLAQLSISFLLILVIKYVLLIRTHPVLTIAQAVVHLPLYRYFPTLA